jgi:hypothetical protein
VLIFDFSAKFYRWFDRLVSSIIATNEPAHSGHLTADFFALPIRPANLLLIRWFAEPEAQAVTVGQNEECVRPKAFSFYLRREYQ